VTKKTGDFNLDNEINVMCDLLNAVEAGNKRRWNPAVLVHLASQKEISLQVVLTEVIFSAQTMCNNYLIFSIIFHRTVTKYSVRKILKRRSRNQ